ncbi:hypothetical protein HW555_013535 [Spodoptera exigua]|uniref:Uncharacterized protein n=1 Tax=Spodoptera exigua TaxID=7107 RepID=A0A835G3Y7_SPOEX|nr:hypothetical protein HW555_013535 [Spodoptera exigua]
MATTVVVGGVLHSPDGAVGFVEGVRALHDITVAGLLLGLVVTGVAVGYGVVVLVFGRELRRERRGRRLGRGQRGRRQRERGGRRRQGRRGRRLLGQRRLRVGLAGHDGLCFGKRRQQLRSSGQEQLGRQRQRGRRGKPLGPRQQRAGQTGRGARCSGRRQRQRRSSALGRAGDQPGTPPLNHTELQPSSKNCIATVVVGGVLHSPDGAVGFVEGVRSPHNITVAGLLLGLVVTGVAVGYGVVVLVFGVSLVSYDGSGVVSNWGGGSVVGDSGSGVVGDGRGGMVGDCWGSDGYALGWLVMTYNVLGRHGSS